MHGNDPDQCRSNRSDRRGEPVDVRRRDRLEVGPVADAGRRAPFALLLRVEVAVEEVPVQAVEQDDDEVRGPIRRRVRSCAQEYAQRFCGSEPSAYSMHCTSNWIGSR